MDSVVKTVFQIIWHRLRPEKQGGTPGDSLLGRNLAAAMKRERLSVLLSLSRYTVEKPFSNNLKGLARKSIKYMQQNPSQEHLI